MPNIWNSSGLTEAERSSDIAKKLFPLVRITRPRPAVLIGCRNDEEEG